MRKSYKIAILGTRGIPNQYGGFEALAEHLSVYLANKGHEVVVYQTHNHPCKTETYKGVTIQRCYNPEIWLGTIGQFGYDLRCQLDARHKDFDVWLHLGYTSNTIWSCLWTKKALQVSNMDGFEWQRSKYSSAVRLFLRWAEKRAVAGSDVCIADHPEIARYLKLTYNIDAHMIRYGASLVPPVKPNVPLPDSFDLVMARMEPENNIQLALESQLHANRPLVIAGNATNRFARHLMKRFPQGKRIHWIGGVYRPEEAEWLRKHCTFYIHGHSVGGTNPSLIQAMASGCRIIAHDNVFTRELLKNVCVGYASNANELAALRRTHPGQAAEYAFPTWDEVCADYEAILCP